MVSRLTALGWATQAPTAGWATHGTDWCGLEAGDGGYGEPVRICYVTTTRLPSEKANGIQITRMCEAFACAGADVILWHPARRQPQPSLETADPFDFYGVRRNFKIAAKPFPDVFRLDLYLSARLFAAVVFVARAVWAVGVAVALRLHHRGTVCYTRDELVCIGSLLLGVPTVLEAHQIPGARTRRLLEVAFRRRRPRGVVVLTPFIAQSFRDIGVPADRVFVQPDAVELDAYADLPGRRDCRRALALPERAVLVGYIGRFETMGMDKGLPELIRGVGEARGELGVDLRVLGVGGPLDGEVEYRRVAAAAGLPDEALILVDRRPHTEVPRWIRACDVVSIPWSFNEVSAYFTSPLKLFEYMAAGSLIVASDLPSLREVLVDRHNALLVEPGSSQALAAALVECVGDRALADRLGAQAAHDVRGYTWESRAREVLYSIGVDAGCADGGSAAPGPSGTDGTTASRPE